MLNPFKSVILEKLGVKSWINAANWTTTSGGSYLEQPVIEAMNEASSTFVDMYELLDKACDKVAELCKVDSAFITSGAGAGMALSTAACMTGKDFAKMLKLPNTEEMKNEVIIQSGEVPPYWQQYQMTGAKLRRVGLPFPKNPDSRYIEAAINDNTACIACVYSRNSSPRGSVPIIDCIQIAKKYDIPIQIDAAAVLPPVANLHKFSDMGADLTIFSGGKGIRGPNDTGLILGSGTRGKELIEAIRMQACPNTGFGRAFKVSKEQIVGLVTALELFVKKDEKLEYKKQMARLEKIKNFLSHLNNIDLEIVPNDEKYHEFPVMAHVPRLKLEWNEHKIGMKAEDLDLKLATKYPPIMLGSTILNPFTNKQIRYINPYLLRDNEVEIIAKRIIEIFSH